MSKAFLSHSSRDKILVEKIAEKLGEKRCVYDKFSFEAGMKTLDEIIRTLDETDLFVIFISDSSLESEWVKKELKFAEEKLKEETIKKIYPIIIDNKITYKDERIPKWISENYNLQIVTQSEKIKLVIERILREITWEKYPQLKEKNNFFSGRNNLVEKLEADYANFDKEVICFIASGFKLIGRKALLKYTLKKIKVLREAQEPIIIKFKADESIEDFILKINNLGILEEVHNTVNFIHENQETKINILVNMIKNLQLSKEIILIDDFGGIILPNGDLVEWFYKILEKTQSSQFIFGISSKFKLKNEYEYPKIGYVNVAVLEKKDRIKMFSQLLEIEKIEFLSRDDKKNICEWFKGYPEQIKHAIEMIKEKKSADEVYNISSKIVDYNNRQTFSIYNECSLAEKEIINLISHLGIIETNFLYKIIGEDKEIGNMLESLESQNICEYSGYTRQYISVSENIQDFVIRSGFTILEKFNKKLKETLAQFIRELDPKEVDHTILEILIKESLRKTSDKQEFNEYILPSHYLKTIIELYKKEKNYREVIYLAKKILESEENLDKYLAREIRKYLCLSLAREKNARILEEAQKIENLAEKNFIIGLYFRKIGQYKKALSYQYNSLEKQPTYLGAQREIIQIFTMTGQTEEALELAKKIYENSDKSNPYTIQAYLSCLIKNRKNSNNDEDISKMKELLTNLQNIDTELSQEMYKRGQITYNAFIKNDNSSLDEIYNLSLESSFSKNHYIYMEMFDIADKFNNLDLMKYSNEKLEELKNIGRKELEYVIDINRIIYNSKRGLDINVDLSQIKSKIPEESFRKLNQRLNKEF